ncbi:MAG: hypothetical protein A3B47_03820 [Candidatus Levybacteria bacterium RIFCSPLOWO2_01_FULL_39_24]|nr:MAG: hypothetical protein A2800_03625 [Candidatus Levybacteria bacterium RIFCSPHIGHO2_01_FULL_40_16]OGH28175.1 MAG: hypothetical protein A3E12_04330 [Candidatus Levybacteria bacterium RIFCSPHIGHO2_12_FULL_39_9]OGH46363.1 MAG: hypothetical protein A3B47_03820 [Candidatus Levybacteria bacterium RIFCSPLOWO2_01_FULL_39_24]
MKKIGLLAYGEMGFSALESLRSLFNVVWVILSPERSNVKLIKFAKKNNIKIFFTNNNDRIYRIAKNTKPEAIVIASYNKILPEKILTLCKCINVHHGDLPRFRGRANINWAIIMDKKKIALTIHEAVSNLDAGNIYKKYQIPITNIDNVETVYGKVNLLLKLDLAHIVNKVIKGYKGKKQIGNPTYCCTRLPEDGLIDWAKSSKDIYNLIRALTKPYPGAFTFFKGKKLIIYNAEIPKHPKIFEGRIPGRVISIIPNYGAEVLTGGSSIIIKNGLYEGKETVLSNVITSVKETLGINFASIYEQLNKYQK